VLVVATSRVIARVLISNTLRSSFTATVAGNVAMATTVGAVTMGVGFLTGLVMFL
jgi:hypothetical protein